MNVNVKISLTDEERRLALLNLTGINRQRMLSRVECNEFVAGAIAGILVKVPVKEELKVKPEGHPLFDLSKVPSKYDDKSEAWRQGWYRGRYVITPSKF